MVLISTSNNILTDSSPVHELTDLFEGLNQSPVVPCFYTVFFWYCSWDAEESYGGFTAADTDGFRSSEDTVKHPLVSACSSQSAKGCMDKTL